MTDIAELKRRVEDAGDHFGRMAEQQRSNGQRVARLLEQVETELGRKRAEIARLGGALSTSEEENGQLRGLLTSLLDAAEANSPGKDMGGEAGGDSVGDFEARIGSLLSERELARSDAAYYLGADEDDEDDETPGSDSPDSATAARAAGGPPHDPPRAEASDDANPSPEDLGAVNRIMQRISLLTGDFVDQEEPASKPSSRPNLGSPALRDG
jgi:hypothetical protein